ncbi:hypothetical protein [Paraburkholderia xenovorans]|uniref:hypothetical protein n=1 Tax=Paraburkholderia xenovorans TaxID=36873 RepID=UPI0038B834D8
MLGNLAANLFVGESLAASVADTFADILEVLVAFVLAPSISTVAELIRPKPLMRFLTGGVLAPVTSGLLGMTLLRVQLNGYSRRATTCLRAAEECECLQNESLEALPEGGEAASFTGL